MSNRVCCMALIGLAMSCHTAGADDLPELRFPGSRWQKVEPVEVGWDAELLAEAVDFAMTRHSSAVVVVHRGRLIVERYQTPRSASVRYRSMTRGQNAEGHPIEDVASVQKSVVSFLLGVAKENSLLRLEDPVHQHLGVGWSSASAEQEAAITLRHLLTMTSGLDAALRFDTPPETRWRYNTAAYAQLIRVLEAASDKDIHALTKDWLTGPAGMTDSRWVPRPLASLATSASSRVGFATTARDLARFGLVMLADGSWNNRELISDREYLRAATSPSQTLNPSYGYLWWLGGQRSSIVGRRRVAGKLIPSAPDDLYAAFGALGRKCYVVPSLGLVVTRLGDSPDRAGERRFDDELWRRLMASAPK